jgi:integrase
VARRRSDLDLLHRVRRPPLFTTARGSRLNRSNLYGRTLRPAAKATGLGWVGFHSFRHTCASLLFAGGKNAKQVQEWLGHHSPAFTLATYVHLLDGGLGDAEFLDAEVVVNEMAVETAHDTVNAQDASTAAAPR